MLARSVHRQPLRPALAKAGWSRRFHDEDLDPRRIEARKLAPRCRVIEAYEALFRFSAAQATDGFFTLGDAIDVLAVTLSIGDRSVRRYLDEYLVRVGLLERAHRHWAGTSQAGYLIPIADYTKRHSLRETITSRPTPWTITADKDQPLRDTRSLFDDVAPDNDGPDNDGDNVVTPDPTVSGTCEAPLNNTVEHDLLIPPTQDFPAYAEEKGGEVASHPLEEPLAAPSAPPATPEPHVVGLEVAMDQGLRPDDLTIDHPSLQHLKTLRERLAAVNAYWAQNPAPRAPQRPVAAPKAPALTLVAAPAAQAPQAPLADEQMVTLVSEAYERRREVLTTFKIKPGLGALVARSAQLRGYPSAGAFFTRLVDHFLAMKAYDWPQARTFPLSYIGTHLNELGDRVELEDVERELGTLRRHIEQRGVAAGDERAQCRRLLARRDELQSNQRRVQAKDG